VDRIRADRLHYIGEAALSATLDDRQRTAQMKELFELYLAFQRDKTPEQLTRELRAEWLLNRGRTNARYLALRREADRADGAANAG